MADNYLLFSEIVPDLNAKERAWAERVLTCEADHERVLTMAGLRTNDVDVNDWPGFQWEITRPGHDLWLYAEASGNAGHAGEVVRALLARFRPAACWTLAWAETCSRPRVGEFGGGGLFVTANEVRAFSAADWLSRRRRAFEPRRTKRRQF